MARRSGRRTSTGSRRVATVTPDYTAPFAFTGHIEHVAIDVSGELIEDKDATMRTIMAHQ